MIRHINPSKQSIFSLDPRKQFGQSIKGKKNSCLSTIMITLILALHNCIHHYSLDSYVHLGRVSFIYALNADGAQRDNDDVVFYTAGEDMTLFPTVYLNFLQD